MNLERNLESTLHYLQACLLTTIIEKIPHAVMVTDYQHTIIYVNAAYEYLTGFKRQDVLGKTPRVNLSSVSLTVVFWLSTRSAPPTPLGT